MPGPLLNHTVQDNKPVKQRGARQQTRHHQGAWPPPQSHSSRQQASQTKGRTTTDKTSSRCLAPSSITQFKTTSQSNKGVHDNRQDIIKVPGPLLNHTVQDNKPVKQRGARQQTRHHQGAWPPPQSHSSRQQASQTKGRTTTDIKVPGPTPQSHSSRQQASQTKGCTTTDKTSSRCLAPHHAEVLAVATLLGDLVDGTEGAAGVTLQLHPVVVGAWLPASCNRQARIATQLFPQARIATQLSISTDMHHYTAVSTGTHRYTALFPQARIATQLSISKDEIV